MTSIVLFRQDLRISDNPALFEAAKNGEVLPVFIFDENIEIGGGSKIWLHNSLKKLDRSLDNNLNFFIGIAKDILPKIIAKNKIDKVYWNRCYEPSRIKEDSEIKAFLKSQKIECHSFNASLLWEPWEVLKSDQTSYKVFTPFYRAATSQPLQPRAVISKPNKLKLIKDENSLNLDDLKLLPKNKWYKKIEDAWQVGEGAAQKKFDEFLKNGINNYKEGRNYPARNNISRLSPHLHFGEISPNQVWHGAKEHSDAVSKIDLAHFLSEIGWREFSYYLLYHFPNLPKKNFQNKFDNFPWQKNSSLLKAWQKGQTGFPIVDAGMRELWQTGYMHNRVRMIVGSFLVKNLLQHWHYGADWFFDCLLDADLANNSAAWQWVAGSGADAAPYFRIFNPVLQGEKFDEDGQYTRHFVPELKNMPNKFLFKPWDAPQNILQEAGVILGKNYPLPIVDVSESRSAAMLAYGAISQKSF